jgi:hypothetical protein
LIVTRAQRTLFAALGLIAYLALAAPEFVRSAWLCGGGAAGPLLGYRCSGSILPDWTHLIAWLVGLPFYLLYLSSRVRKATTIGMPFRSPRSTAWGAGLLMILLALVMVYASWPDWTTDRARVDLVSCIVWPAMALYLTALLTLRTETDLQPRATHRGFRHLGWSILGSGLFLYAGIFVAEVLHMQAAASQCPAGSVCDMPAMGFIAFMTVVWLPGWVIFVPFLLSAADRAGIKPWPDPEPRIGAILTGIVLFLWGATMFRMGSSAIPAGLYYVCFGGWFFLVQHLCGKSAQTVALENSGART